MKFHNTTTNVASIKYVLTTFADEAIYHECVVFSIPELIKKLSILQDKYNKHGSFDSTRVRAFVVNDNIVKEETWIDY